MSDHILWKLCDYQLCNWLLKLIPVTYNPIGIIHILNENQNFEAVCVAFTLVDLKDLHCSYNLAVRSLDSRRSKRNKARANPKFLPWPCVSATAAENTNTARRVWNWQEGLVHMSTSAATDRPCVQKKNNTSSWRHAEIFKKQGEDFLQKSKPDARGLLNQ